MSDRRDFDAAAASWDRVPQRVELAWAVAEAIRREVPLRGDMKLMDYGCGTGLLALALQPHVGKIVAADSSEGMLEVLSGKLAEAEIGNVRPLLLDLEAQELPESGFDLIVSNMTFHHLREPALVLGKLAAGLKCDGWVAFSDLDRGSEDFHGDNSGVYHHGFSAEERLEMCEQAGLEAVQTVEAHCVVKPVGEGLKGFPVLLTVARRV